MNAGEMLYCVPGWCQFSWQCPPVERGDGGGHIYSRLVTGALHTGPSGLSVDWGLLVICGSVWVWGGWESEKRENEERNGWKCVRWRNGKTSEKRENEERNGWKESEVEVEETE